LQTIGDGAATFQRLEANYGGCKRCLSGSDAHGPDAVARPDLYRFCWVKLGALDLLRNIDTASIA
jgi:hypothetical protein